MARLGLRIRQRMVKIGCFWYFLAIFFSKKFNAKNSHFLNNLRPHFDSQLCPILNFCKRLLAPGCLETCVNGVLKFKFSIFNLFSKMLAALSTSVSGPISYSGGGVCYQQGLPCLVCISWSSWTYCYIFSQHTFNEK